LAAADLEPSSGIQALLEAGDVEEAALGSAAAIMRLSRRGSSSRSRQQLRDAREQAELTGLLGEELVFDHLTLLKDAGDIADFSWTSQDNAVALYDFEVTGESGSQRIEVKTTSGAFGTPIHISFGELLVMAEGEQPHLLYRVFEATEGAAILRIATNTQELARAIVHSVSDLTERGIVPDSFTLKPSLLEFGPEIPLERSAGGEGDDA
jgi:hypothetical protein